MKLTVFGATGATGREVVQQALDAGHEVTAVVRDPARLHIPDHERLDVATVPGVTDPQELLPVVHGRDAVISALGPNNNRQARHSPVARTGLQAITSAMDAAGVRRVSALSAAPVGRPSPDDNVFTRTLGWRLIRFFERDTYADLGGMEQVLADGDTEWTVIRPPMLVDTPFTGTYRRVVGGNVAAARTISRADVADALLTVLSDPATVRQAVGVAA